MAHCLRRVGELSDARQRLGRSKRYETTTIDATFPA